jgi:hypothetical protein
LGGERIAHFVVGDHLPLARLHPELTIIVGTYVGTNPGTSLRLQYEGQEGASVRHVEPARLPRSQGGYVDGVLRWLDRRQ